MQHVLNVLLFRRSRPDLHAAKFLSEAFYTAVRSSVAPNTGSWSAVDQRCCAEAKGAGCHATRGPQWPIAGRTAATVRPGPACVATKRCSASSRPGPIWVQVHGGPLDASPTPQGCRATRGHLWSFGRGIADASRPRYAPPTREKEKEIEDADTSTPKSSKIHNKEAGRATRTCSRMEYSLTPALQAGASVEVFFGERVGHSEKKDAAIQASRTPKARKTRRSTPRRRHGLIRRRRSRRKLPFTPPAPAVHGGHSEEHLVDPAVSRGTAPQHHTSLGEAQQSHVITWIFARTDSRPTSSTTRKCTLKSRKSTNASSKA
ncbi:uncharacterized protein LOC144178360 [Haemaphysalis longicornis]